MHCPPEHGGTLPHPWRGFSLVELLVAMTLGLILLGGMIAVFAGNRRSADINEATTDMQESVRYALAAIAGDIRMAGHQGCLDFNGSAIDIIARAAPTADLRETAIGGAVVQSDKSWRPPTALGSGGGRFVPPDTAVVGTHALTVQFGGPATVRLRDGMKRPFGAPDPSVALPLDGRLDLSEGDLALVSTCEHGELFAVSEVTLDGTGENMSLGHTSMLNTRSDFLEAYGVNETREQVRVMPFSTHVYYVGDTGMDNGDGEDVRALYQQSAPFGDPVNNPPVQLVRGVENMRLSFGVGSAGGHLRYVNSTDADYDASRIRSVRIGLLMSSFEAIATDTDTSTYVLAGHDIEPSTSSSDGTDYKADRRFRLAFNTTVKVRNRRAER